MNIKNKLTWIFFIVFIAVASVGLSVMAAIQLGTEEITFTQPIIVSAPALPTHAATKGYVDSAIVDIGIGGYVPTSRTISTTNGITGGGDLTANRTLSLDSTVVRTTGNQTIGGTKTFSSAVVLSTAGTATTHAVRADRTISTTNGITGGGDLTANRTLSLDSTVVRTTGDQTIAGTKTFTGTVIFNNPIPIGAPTADNHAATMGYVNSAVAGSASKWTTSGTNIYNANSGNVGIGTSSPGYKLTINGSIGTPDTNNPYLVLDSSSSGGNNAEQSAQISLGESGRGSASLHLAYTGDGYSYIGMGSLTNNIPTYYAMRMYYQNNSVYFPGSLSVVGTATVGTPTSGSHAATKAYVDSAIVNIGIGGYVPTSRTISTTNGITGGGDLTANRTLSLDSTVIRTTGNQTIAGTKTFSSAVVLSTAGTATTHAVRADRTISTTNGITGGGDLTANRTLSLDSTVVRTSGDQTIAGIKTFSSPVVVATPTGPTHATTKAYVDTAISNATSWHCGDIFTDPRDSNIYPTVQIGDQCWMAKNLAYLPSVVGPGTGSATDPLYYVHNSQETNTTIAKSNTNYIAYGVLYNWPAATTACPSGWHLPTDAEFTILTNTTGNTEEALISAGWFNNLFVGYRNTDGSFGNLGSYALFWSSSASSSSDAWRRNLYASNSTMYRSYYNKAGGFSVRCLRD